MIAEVKAPPEKDLFSANKVIPGIYRNVILAALSHYPELRRTRIIFRLKSRHPYPYSARPSLSSFFKKAAEREYIITLRENARAPVLHALLKNLPQKARIGILGHELAHVTQYNSLNRLALFKTALQFFIPSCRRETERQADRICIEHGLREELYEHAVHIRSIPGYAEKRKKINKYYLLPAEIESFLQTIKTNGQPSQK